jgi:hypothetical protein
VVFALKNAGSQTAVNAVVDPLLLVMFLVL